MQKMQRQNEFKEKEGYENDGTARIIMFRLIKQIVIFYKMVTRH